MIREAKRKELQHKITVTVAFEVDTTNTKNPSDESE